MLQVFQAVLPQGPVHIPGLAEPAAADAADGDAKQDEPAAASDVDNGNP